MAFMYCKLFASLYQGTLRGKSHEILVFTNMLAHADAEGCVDKHFRAIADEVGLSVDEVKAAVQNLESPDPESRSPEMDGRRLLRINDHRAWGWKIVNYGKYREIKNDEDRRKANREAQARWRERQKNKASVSITVTDSNQSVISSNAMSSASAQEEVKEEEEGKVEEVVVSKAKVKKSQSIEIPFFDESDAIEFRTTMTEWFDYKAKRKERYIHDGWIRLLSQQRRFPVHYVKASIDASIRNSWKGLFTGKITEAEAEWFKPQAEVATQSEEEHPLATWFMTMESKRKSLETPSEAENQQPSTENDAYDF